LDFSLDAISHRHPHEWRLAAILFFFEGRSALKARDAWRTLRSIAVKVEQTSMVDRKLAANPDSKLMKL
jgi:hypothetical protein